MHSVITVLPHIIWNIMLSVIKMDTNNNLGKLHFFTLSNLK